MAQVATTDNRNSIDWGKTDINKLYLKILIPTLLGMVSTVVVTITDGYFVGQYAGSDALAAVNIAAPLFLIATAFALMFGVGSSVVASVHISQGKPKAANINITQAIIVSELLFILLSLFVFFNSEQVSVWFGATERLLPLVETYVRIITLSLIFYMMQNLGLFLIRLDGSPRFAMMCSLIPAVINIIADYLLVAHYDMGIKGAVIATASSFTIGGLMALGYLLFFSKTLKLYRLKLSTKSLRLTLRNISYMARLGFAAFLSEGAVAVMMFVGNGVFMNYYGEDGVAAYSVVCYYFPIIFMINNAISQSAQPIISYNYGAALSGRIKQAFRLTLIYGVSFSTIITIGVILAAPSMVSLFLDSSYPAYAIATKGLPYFAIGYVFFAVNMMYMGYFQSIEDYKSANYVSLLRGYLWLTICFYALPALIGEMGVWLAVPLAEVITFLILMISRLLFPRTPINNTKTTNTWTVTDGNDS